MQTGNHIHEYREKAADCDVLNDNVKKYNKEFNAIKKDWMSKKGEPFQEITLTRHKQVISPS